MTCQNCGLVDHVIYKNDYIDFYENMYKMRKKSTYTRKYHVKNVLTDIELKNELGISRDIINRVCKKFDLISMVLHIVNKDRRRIISMKFIIHKLFKMWNLPYVIDITKSKKTLESYEKYWNQLCLLIEL